MGAKLTAQEQAVLSATGLLGSLTPEELEEALAAPACRCADYARGDVIYAPHAFSRSLGVLLTGSVEVTKGELLVSCLARGEIFGAAALFNAEEDYATTLTARGPCRVVFFPQELMTRLMETCPRLAMAYVDYLSGRIRFLSRRLEDVLAGGAERRLEQYLAVRAAEEGPVLDCPATQLARRLNVSRASLYRAFEALEAQGVIHREGKTVLLCRHLERN